MYRIRIDIPRRISAIIGAVAALFMLLAPMVRVEMDAAGAPTIPVPFVLLPLAVVDRLAFPVAAVVFFVPAAARVDPVEPPGVCRCAEEEGSEDGGEPHVLGRVQGAVVGLGGVWMVASLATSIR
jgi:hypothetical protein